MNRVEVKSEQNIHSVFYIVKKCNRGVLTLKKKILSTFPSGSFASFSGCWLKSVTVLFIKEFTISVFQWKPELIR